MKRGRVFRFTTNNQINDHLYCSICKEVFYKPIRASCGHTFCGSCIISWLQLKKNCPICRHRLGRSFQYDKDLLATKFVNDLNVQCMRCDVWEGTLAQLHHHIKQCKAESSCLMDEHFDVNLEDSVIHIADESNHDIVFNVPQVETEPDQQLIQQYSPISVDSRKISKSKLKFKIIIQNQQPHKQLPYKQEQVEQQVEQVEQVQQVQQVDNQEVQQLIELPNDQVDLTAKIAQLLPDEQQALQQVGIEWIKHVQPPQLLPQQPDQPSQQLSQQQPQQPQPPQPPQPPQESQQPQQPQPPQPPQQPQQPQLPQPPQQPQPQQSQPSSPPQQLANNENLLSPISQYPEVIKQLGLAQPKQDTIRNPKHDLEFQKLVNYVILELPKRLPIIITRQKEANLLI